MLSPQATGSTRRPRVRLKLMPGPCHAFRIRQAVPGWRRAMRFPLGIGILPAFLVPSARPAEPVSCGFAYIRADRVGTGNGQRGRRRRVAMLVTVSLGEPPEFQTRELPLQGVEVVRPLAVGGNTLYMKGKLDSLLALDLATGELRLVLERASYPVAPGDGRIYFATRDKWLALDLRTRTVVSANKPSTHARGSTVPFSPRRGRIAWVGRQRSRLNNTCVVRVTDMATSRSTAVVRTRWSPPLMSSLGGLGPGPPVMWLDDRQILTLRTEPVRQQSPDRGYAVAIDPETGALALRPEPGGRLTVAKREYPVAEREYVVAVDTSTGEVEDFVGLPGARDSRNPVFLLVPGAGPLVIAAGISGIVSYRLDTTEKRLVEGPIPLGPAQAKGIAGWRDAPVLRVRELTFKGARLAEYASAVVSPDASRLVYCTPSSRPRSNDLYYLDDSCASPCRVATGAVGHLVWFSSTDLDPVIPANAGTQPLGFQPYPAPAPAPPKRDVLPDVSTALALEATTDRVAYSLHQPVTLTLTLKNISTQELVVADLKFMRGSVTAIYRPPRFSRSLDDYGTASLPARITLTSGQSISRDFPVEPGKPGDYTIDQLEYGGYPADRFSGGRVRASPVSFAVESTPDDSRLLVEKVARVAAIFRTSAPPDGATSGHRADDTIRDVGNEAAPVLLEALAHEKHVTARHWLMIAVGRLSHPAVVGPAKTWLAGDDRLAHACAVQALASVVRASSENAVLVEALEAIASALDVADQPVRRRAARVLSGTFHPRTDELLTAALDNADPDVRDRAARYLAAVESVTLVDFLDLAIAEPTRPRYIAARVAVKALESHAHCSKGALPAVDFAAFAADEAARGQFSATLGEWLAWAKEHPKTSERFFSSEHQAWHRR